MLSFTQLEHPWLGIRHALPYIAGASLAGYSACFPLHSWSIPGGSFLNLSQSMNRYYRPAATIKNINHKTKFNLMEYLFSPEIGISFWMYMKSDGMSILGMLLFVVHVFSTTEG
jgi:hypothetical protein